MVKTFHAAARAPEYIDSAVAVANGTAVYLGEAHPLQAVSASGTLSTLGRFSVGGLGLGPHRALYVISHNEVERLAGRDLGPVVSAARFKRLRNVPPLGSLQLGSVDADGKGDLYISAMGIGYDLYELTRSGQARFVSPFRGANGKPAPLSAGPGGVVYGEWQNAIYQARGNGISLFQGFSDGTVPGYGGTFLPAFIAASGTPKAPLYADADGAMASRWRARS